MLIRTAVFSAAVAVSIHAQAGLIQYNFDQVSWSDGGSLSGYFVQDEVSRKIVHYGFALEGGDLSYVNYTPEAPFGNLTRAWLGTQQAAPTFFEAYALYVGGSSKVGLEFRPTADEQVFEVAGWNADSYQPDPNDASSISLARRTVSQGFAVAGAVDPWVSSYLESLPPDAPWAIADISPTLPGQLRGLAARQIPEPGSLALLAIGAAAALGLAKRRSRG